MGFIDFVKQAFIFIITLAVVGGLFFGGFVGFLWVLGKVVG